MDNLSDVISTCRGLLLEKVTERKKNADKFRQLLSKSSVIKALDKYSDEKGSEDQLTWDYVFKTVAKYVVIETQHLQKSKEQTSTASLTRKEKAKKEVSDLVKFVIRQADKRGPRLKCSSLLNHVDDILQDEFMCRAYGVDYSNILLKNILTVRMYWVEITSSAWHNLITVYVRMYSGQEYGIDKTLLSRVISTLISGATTQCDVRPKRLLNFFTEVFKNIRQEKTLAVIENLLTALNVFINHIASNSRAQICKLGEAIFINMLYIWENRPTLSLKSELIEFLRVQMHAHHPGGCKRDTPGAFALDWDTWMSHLRKLYEVMYGDFQQLGGRKRFSGGCRDATLPPEYIDLAAEVCNQLFQDSEHVLEVTQISETQDRPGAKKRRLESGWTSIRDIIMSLGQTAQLIPWLQLIRRVMEKFPRSLAEEEVHSYLSCFSPLIAEVKNAEVAHHLLSCVESFAGCWNKRECSQRMVEMCRPLWRQIWMSTLRCVSLHHTAPQGLKLLKAMVVQGIMVVDKEVWSLFLPGICIPTTDSVDLLLAILQRNAIPEKYQPSVLTSGNYSNTQYPLRSQLIDWMLASSDITSAKNSEACPESVAHVLVLLMVKNQSNFLTFLQRETDFPFTDLENIYLQSSHKFPVTNKFLQNKPASGEMMDPVAIPVLLSRVEKMLEQEAMMLSDVTDIQTYHTEKAAMMVRLISRIIYWTLEYKVVDSSQVMKLDLINLCKMVYKRLAHFMAETVQKDGPSAVTTVLSSLQTVFEAKDDGKQSDVIVARIVRCLCPTKITDLLLGMVNEKITKQSSSTTQSDIGHIKLSSRYRPNQSRRVIEEDDMDLEFDQPMARDQGEEEEEEFGDSQESEESSNSSFQSPLCPSSLTDIQRVRLTALRILCMWCGHDKPEMMAVLPLQSLADPQHVRGKIEELIDEEELDSTKIYDIQVLDIVVRGLMTGCHSITDTDVENTVDAIRRVTKKQRKDQNVSCMCLDLLSVVVKYLGHDDLPTKTIADCRDIAVHLLSAFWKLQDQFSSKVRLATARCLMAFIEADPKSDWALLTTEGENGESVASEFIQTMSDLSLEVRMYATQLVSRLFMSGEVNPIPAPRHLQMQRFEKIYEIVNEMLEVTSRQGSLSAERELDEKNNRAATAVTTIGNIMCTSVVCENKAILALCQLVRECEMDIVPVRKVLETVSHILGYASGHNYMSYHLPFVVHHWLGLGYPIAEFPYQLTFCSSRVEFYRDFFPVIIPLLMIKKNVLWGKEIVTEIRESWEDTLRQCIPQIVVHMFPLFALAESGSLSVEEALKNRISNANQCYDLLTKEATREVVEKTLVSRLEDVVVNTLMCLYDPEEEFVRSGSIRNIDPESNPPCFNTYMVKVTLEYITQSFSGGNKTLVEVLSKNQDSIQKIVLELAKKLNQQHRLHEKRRIFLMYQLFIKLLLREFAQQLGGSWAYLLRETTHRLLYIAKDVLKINMSGICDHGYSENIICMSLQLLRDICITALEVCPEELSKYLSFIISSLVPMVTVPSEAISQKASSLLHLLIIDNKDTLQQSIVRLDPFPDDARYQSLSTMYRKLKYSGGPFSLKQDVDHFLSSSTIYTAQKEGLHHLALQLHQKKQQLLSSQHTDKKRISELIFKLVQMLNGAGDDVAIETCKCLGEIGAVDLETTVMVDDTIDTIATEFSGSYRNYCKIFHILNQYLVEDDMTVVEAASDVLKTLLSTQTGHTFATQYKDKMGEREFLFQYLHPFRPRKKLQSVKPDSLSVEEFQQIIDVESLWTPDNSCHGNWINNLACTLIHAGVQDEILSQLQPICMIKTKFSEMVLPLLIHDLLVQDLPIHREILSSHFRRFFSDHVDEGNQTRSSSAISLTSKDSTCVTLDKDSIRTMLNVVQYLRQQDTLQQGRRVMTAWDNNFWLDLDFLHLSKAAIYCGAHFSAVLFAEIWCDIQRQAQDYSGDSQKGTGFSQGFSQATVIDSLGLNSNASINVQDLLLEAYQRIGDPDGLYGCGAGRLAKTSSRVKCYEHENKWEKAMVTYDIELSLPVLSCQPSCQSELLQALHNLGSVHVLERYLQTMDTDMSDHMRDLQFQSAWRSGQWTLEPTSRLENTSSFNEAVYSALVAVKDGNSHMVEKSANTARLLTMEKLCVGRMESVSSLYPVLGDLQCVSQIDDILRYNILNKEGYDKLTTRWQDSLPDMEFTYLEPTLSMRCCLLRMLQHADPSLSVCYQHQLLKLAELARECGRHQIAERAIFNLKEMESADFKLQIPKLIEEANLYWARNEQNTAKHLMKNLITKLEKLQDDSIDAAIFYPRVLSIYGNWLAETRSENPNVIMEDYLEKTVGLLEALHERGDIALDAYLSLARYADSQYQNIINYMKSSTYEAKQNLMKKAQAEVESLREIVDPSKDRYFKILSKQCNIDKAEIEAMNTDKTRFLQKAVENYLQCLKYGDKHDLRVFRLVSLWFSNSSDEGIHALIEKNVPMLKSYKFLPLMYQLAARMDTKAQGQNFQAILNKIIERSSLDHPHHTLMCVLALAHAKKDTEILTAASKSGRRSKLTKSTSDPNKEEGRVEAAKLMIAKLKNRTPVTDIVENLEKLCTAYIQLANCNVDQYKKETRPIQLQNSLLLTKIKDLHNVALPTVDIKVDPSCQYRDIISLKGFQSTFKLAGGINLPKIIGCIGSDGKVRRQLVKGRDDLRQDAVMQQVFGMVNNLLQKNSQTKKRKLHVRQYKVVPLSQMSGLLEWCEGTMPIGEYLVANIMGDESPGAHCRYRPEDYTALECRRHMSGVHGSTDTLKKYKVFLAICKKFQPVFRHFFMEKFRDPTCWFEARLAYTKSVATNSIVGYILGLGDRHVQNILVDCNTAELVHIDLGVAFEQGKILPTPETVPFRLTRDIVDGMGVSGVEGVFRRCCEKTMEVMHNNQEALITILEVLLYDPLYAWSMSPAKAFALQQRRDRDPDASELNITKDVLDFAEPSQPAENVNKLAERVLLRLHQKLQGIEDGVQFSVSGQVNLLIQEARDPKNLSRLFPGWQPYI